LKLVEPRFATSTFMAILVGRNTPAEKLIVGRPLTAA
jgi:hypothetical protein